MCIEYFCAFPCINMTQRVHEGYTEWKVSVFGVIPVRIQFECGKIRTRITPNTGTFYSVIGLICTKIKAKISKSIDITLEPFWTRIILYFKVFNTITSYPQSSSFINLTLTSTSYSIYISVETVFEILFLAERGFWMVCCHAISFKPSQNLQ